MAGKGRSSQELFVFLALCIGLMGAVLLNGLVSHAAPALTPLDPPWDANVRVNDDASAAASQSVPALAASQTTSDVYAVWADDRNGDADIYVARSIDGGQTWGVSFRVNDDAPGNWQQQPDVAIDGVGTLHAAWVDSREGGNDVYYARSIDGGQTWSLQGRVNDVVTGTQSSPAIAVYSNTVCVAWSDSRNGTSDVYADCSSDGGLNWGTDSRVNDDAVATYDHYAPDVAIVASGRVHVVWYDDRDGDDNVYYAHSLAAGGWLSNLRLNHDVGTTVQKTPFVAAISDTVHAIWEDGRDGVDNLYANVSLDGGDTWLTFDQRANDVSGVDTPGLAVDGKGTAWSTWRVISGGQYILYSDVYGVDGWGAADAVITASTAYKQNPAIAGGGGVYAAWEQSSDVLLSAWGGSAWGDAVKIDGEGEARQERPGLAVGAGGDVYAAWMDYRNGSYSADLYAARSIDGGQTWGANGQVNDAVGIKKAPALAAVGPFTVHVAWEADLAGYTAIYYDRSADGGQSWGVDQRLSRDPMSYPAESPDVAVSGTHQVYVVWTEFSRLHLAQSPDGGTNWVTSTEGIITTTGGIYNPALAAGATGTLHLAWEEHVLNDRQICYARSTNGGQTWTGRTCFGWAVAASYQTDPDVAVDPVGGWVHLVWADPFPGSEGIYHTVSTDDGLAWSTKVRVSGGPGAVPAVTAEGDGSVYVTWQGAPAGDEDIYYASSPDGGSSWDTPGRVNDDATTWPQGHPAIASGSGVYVAWDDFRRVNWDIYATALITVCPVPLDTVRINGASAITTGLPITLTAVALPANATPPVAYVWSPAPASGQGTATAVYYWHRPGGYEVSVTASNCGGPVSATHQVAVSAPPPPLPCVEGNVTYATTGLAGVRVDLIAGTDPQSTPVQTTTTGPAGQYGFCGLTPGTYLLKRYGPTAEYTSWVADWVNVGGSNVVRRLDLPKRMTLLSPDDQEVVYTSIPTLTWQALPEAGRYTLQLNRTAGWDLVEHRPGLVDTSYRVGTTLTWGISYTWQIDAYTGTHWVGTTPDNYRFTVAPFHLIPITFTLPPIASVNSSLRVEDAPADVAVNKLIGDSTGETNVTYVDVVAYVWTLDSEVASGANVILSVPDDKLGAPVNTWVRSSAGGPLTAVPYTNLGGGSYQVTTDMVVTFPCIFPCHYRRQVVWRFRIPHTISPQTLELEAHVEAPGYLVFGSWSDASLRLVKYPMAIIVANRSLLYDNHTDYQVTQLLQQLYTVAQGGPYNEHPLGVIYYVDRYSALASAWDNTAINYASEATANQVADEIDDLVEDWVEDGTGTLFSFHLLFSTTVSLEWRPPYLLIVGDDQDIPLYRYNDPTNDEGINVRSSCPAADGWCVDSAANPAVHATDEDYILTDNVYGDLWGGTDWRQGDLELAVGRLLGETAADMLTLLNSSLATDGSTGRAVMASVDGWELGMAESPGCGSTEIHDVLNVPGRLVARGFNVRNDTETPHTVDVMSPFDTGWNAGFRTAANGGMDIFFIGGHDSYDHASIPGDDFSPDDTCASGTCDYHRFDNDHPLAFIVGCHGGLPVPDVGLSGGADDDMVYDLVREGARAFIGATGFSYGSPGSLCYTTWGERLLQGFFDEFLPVGSKSLPIGAALSRAKDNYTFGFRNPGATASEGDALDRKTVTEFNLYGVPWQRLDYPGGSLNATAAGLRRAVTPAAVSRRMGPVARASSFHYTRAITVGIASYTEGQVITGGVTYDLLSIPGGGMALAPSLPVLPYVAGYTLTLPLSATVQGVTLTGSTCAGAGSYEIPIVVAQPWTEGGTSFTTTTSIDALYPPDDELVRYQQQGSQVLFTLHPIRHNPTSNETTFCSQMALQVAYDAPLALAVSQPQPQAEQVAPGDIVTVSVTVENVGDALATFTATLTVEDAHGDPIGWQDGGPFSVAAGAQEELSIAWDGDLDEGTYALQLVLYQGGQVVGMAAGGVKVVGGALTGLEAPAVPVELGMQAAFTVTFANYRTAGVTATVRLVIHDVYGDPVLELESQTGPVGSQDISTFSFAWTPDEVPGGTYTAWALVETEDEVTYGPAVQAFEVAGGYDVYLPVILKP